MRAPSSLTAPHLNPRRQRKEKTLSPNLCLQLEWERGPVEHNPQPNGPPAPGPIHPPTHPPVQADRQAGRQGARDERMDGGMEGGILRPCPRWALRKPQMSDPGPTACPQQQQPACLGGPRSHSLTLTPAALQAKRYGTRFHARRKEEKRERVEGGGRKKGKPSSGEKRVLWTQSVSLWLLTSMRKGMVGLGWVGRGRCARLSRPCVRAAKHQSLDLAWKQSQHITCLIATVKQNLSWRCVMAFSGEVLGSSSVFTR